MQRWTERQRQMDRQMGTWGRERERHEDRRTGETRRRATGQTGSGTDKSTGRDEWTDGQTPWTKEMDGEVDEPTGRGQRAKQADPPSFRHGVQGQPHQRLRARGRADELTDSKEVER